MSKYISMYNYLLNNTFGIFHSYKIKSTRDVPTKIFLKSFIVCYIVSIRISEGSKTESISTTDLTFQLMVANSKIWKKVVAIFCIYIQIFYWIFFFIDQVFNPSLHLTHAHDTFHYSSLSNSAWLTFPARSISEKALNSLFYLADSIFGVAHNAL